MQRARRRRPREREREGGERENEQKNKFEGSDDENAAAVPLGNLRCEQIRLYARVSRKEPPSRLSMEGGGRVRSGQGGGIIALGHQILGIIIICVSVA